MATEVVKVVDPDAGAGYDYDALADWEADLGGTSTGNLPVDDQIAVAKCRCTGGTNDSGVGMDIAGWSTDATRYIKIWTDPAEGYRLPGKWIGTGNYYRLDYLSDWGDVQESYVRIDGIGFTRAVEQDSYYFAFDPIESGTVGIYITNCVLTATAAAHTMGAGFFFTNLNTGGTIVVANCVADNINNPFYCRPNGAYVYLYNNTSYNCTYGFVSRGPNIYARNLLSVGCTDGFYEETAWASITHSGYDEGTDPGTNGVDLSGYTDAQIFVDVANKDFHLVAGSPVIGVGTNLYNDAAYPFQTDIDGQDRGGSGATWDIGADEYIAAAFTPKRRLNMLLRLCLSAITSLFGRILK